MKRLPNVFAALCLFLLAISLPASALSQSPAELTLESAQQVLDQWSLAFATGDADLMAGLVTDDVVVEQIDPTGTLARVKPIVGKDALLKQLIVASRTGVTRLVVVLSVEEDTVSTAEVWQSNLYVPLGVTPLFAGEVTFRDGKIAHYVTRWAPQAVAALHTAHARQLVATDFVDGWLAPGNEALAFWLADDVELQIKSVPAGFGGEVAGKEEVLARIAALNSIGLKLAGMRPEYILGSVLTMQGRIQWPHLLEFFGASIPATLELTFTGDKIGAISLAGAPDQFRAYRERAEASGVITPTVLPARESKGGLVHLYHVSPALTGNLVGDAAARDLIVYLPPGYHSSDQQYPVTWLVHWYTGTGAELPSAYVVDYERRLAAGTYPPMLLAMVDCANTFGGCYYTDSATNGGYDTYISRELVDLVDSTFRTLPQAASRGITGCSMGGEGAIMLALRHPDVFGLSVPMAAGYSCDDPLWVENTYTEMETSGFDALPQTLDDFSAISWRFKEWYAIASYATPNADNPPLYLDHPFEETDDGLKFSAAFVEACNASFPTGLLDAYLAQPVRLRGLQIYHSTSDSEWSIEHVREFSQQLTDAGIEHDFVEVPGGHCSYPLSNAFDFLAATLALEMEE